MHLGTIAERLPLNMEVITYSFTLCLALSTDNRKCVALTRTETEGPGKEPDDEVTAALERAAAELVIESSVTQDTSANAALTAAAGASYRQHGIIR
jgi:hypothetical protein